MTKVASHPSVDTYLGMAFSNLVAFFIILTAAATLHAHREPEAMPRLPVGDPWLWNAIFGLAARVPIGVGLA